MELELEDSIQRLVVGVFLTVAWQFQGFDEKGLRKFGLKVSTSRPTRCSLMWENTGFWACGQVGKAPKQIRTCVKVEGFLWTRVELHQGLVHMFHSCFFLVSCLIHPSGADPRTTRVRSSGATVQRQETVCLAIRPWRLSWSTHPVDGCQTGSNFC